MLGFRVRARWALGRRSLISHTHHHHPNATQHPHPHGRSSTSPRPASTQWVPRRDGARTSAIYTCTVSRFGLACVRVTGLGHLIHGFFFRRALFSRPPHNVLTAYIPCPLSSAQEAGQHLVRMRPRHRKNLAARLARRCSDPNPEPLTVTRTPNLNPKPELERKPKA